LSSTLSFVSSGSWFLNGTPTTLLTSNGSYGETTTLGAVGAATQFNVYYWTSSSTWAKTFANSAATSKGFIAMARTTNFSGSMLVRGYVYNSAWNWTIGGILYLSAVGGSGLITQTAPSGTGDIVRVVGYAITADLIYFNPSQDWIEIA